ncbi:MAG: hypothetical protein JRI66_10960 [Deltaproteobacteria bacterium]|nr:hypothetical protein [Deltaproteobacteria bacterium]
MTRPNLKLIPGKIQSGMWQSDRRAYSDEDIEALNTALENLARDYFPGIHRLIWEIKGPPELKMV